MLLRVIRYCDAEKSAKAEFESAKNRSSEFDQLSRDEVAERRK
jgi:hypothetical protein